MLMPLQSEFAAKVVFGRVGQASGMKTEWQAARPGLSFRLVKVAPTVVLTGRVPDCRPPPTILIPPLMILTMSPGAVTKSPPTVRCPSRRYTNATTVAAQHARVTH